MKLLLQLSILISSLLETKQDAQYLDFGDSLDTFQNCSIQIIQSDLEVRPVTSPPKHIKVYEARHFFFVCRAITTSSY